MGVPASVPFGQSSYCLTGYLSTVSTAGQIYVVVPRDGYLEKVWSVLNGTIATANAGITVKKNGTAIGTITITASGSAAGDMDSVAVNEDVTAGDVIEFETDGSSTNAIAAVFTCQIWV